jgi:hypothetical protein
MFFSLLLVCKETQPKSKSTQFPMPSNRAQEFDSKCEEIEEEEVQDLFKRLSICYCREVMLMRRVDSCCQQGGQGLDLT